MNCIAIDDEPLALDVIQNFCEKIDFLNLEATYTNALEAVTYLNNNSIDLIFLDIQMPHISGLEFLKTLTNPPLIIFTTAYSEHAIEGFELNAVDYLVKPIPFERFFKAGNKALELYNLRQRNIQSFINQNENEQQAAYMLVKVEYTSIKVNFKEIQYIEGLKDYVKIYLVNKPKPILTKSTMKNIENTLPEKEFLRIHKSYIVSISKIEVIDNSRIVFGDKRIPIGPFYKENFNHILDRFRL